MPVTVSSGSGFAATVLGAGASGPSTPSATVDGGVGDFAAALATLQGQLAAGTQNGTAGAPVPDDKPDDGSAPSPDEQGEPAPPQFDSALLPIDSAAFPIDSAAFPIDSATLAIESAVPGVSSVAPGRGSTDSPVEGATPTIERATFPIDSAVLPIDSAELRAAASAHPVHEVGTAALPFGRSALSIGKGELSIGNGALSIGNGALPIGNGELSIGGAGAGGVGLPAAPGGMSAMASTPAATGPFLREEPRATSPGHEAAGPMAAPHAPAPLGATSGSTPVPATPVPPGFAAQLARPMISLAAGPPGEHVVTIRVTPENLGPVTVRAHIGSDGVRIELFAPTDVGRAAVQAVLSDLRRDLAGTGLEASLDLSDRGAPPQDPSTAEDAGHRGADARPDDSGGGVAPLSSTSRRTGSAQLPPLTPSTRLDVLA